MWTPQGAPVGEGTGANEAVPDKKDNKLIITTVESDTLLWGSIVMCFTEPRTEPEFRISIYLSELAASPPTI